MGSSPTAPAKYEVVGETVITADCGSAVVGSTPSLPPISAYSIMERTVGYGPTDVGSNPTGRAIWDGGRGQSMRWSEKP